MYLLGPSLFEVVQFHGTLKAGLPVFGTGIVLAERVFALGIASQPAETNAAIDPVAEKQTASRSVITRRHSPW